MKKRGGDKVTSLILFGLAMMIGSVFLEVRLSRTERVNNKGSIRASHALMAALGALLIVFGVHLFTN